MPQRGHTYALAWAPREAVLCSSSSPEPDSTISMVTSSSRLSSRGAGLGAAAETGYGVRGARDAALRGTHGQGPRASIFQPPPPVMPASPHRVGCACPNQGRAPATLAAEAQRAPDRQPSLNPRGLATHTKVTEGLTQVQALQLCPASPHQSPHTWSRSALDLLTLCKGSYSTTWRPPRDFG